MWRAASPVTARLSSRGSQFVVTNALGARKAEFPSRLVIGKEGSFNEDRVLRGPCFLILVTYQPFFTKMVTRRDVQRSMDYSVPQ